MCRPFKPIDWVLVDKLLEAGCLGTEIAANFDMHPNTFYDRVVEKHGMSFTDYSCEKRARGQSILRATQYYKAIGESKKGDNTLLIWLGKQRLDQKENVQEIQVSGDIDEKFLALMAQFSPHAAEKGA